jgi:hypothetical protein
MKKVIFSISAMLFVGAISYAQPNVSHVNQMGLTQTATVTQRGFDQHSDVTQRNASNVATVHQGLNPNQVNVLGFNISNDNEARVLQDGRRNTAYISQNNWSNSAIQTQMGDDNNATIWQDETMGIFTFPLLNLGHDTAIQTQTGKHNTATIDQGTSGNPLPTAFASFSPVFPGAPVLPTGYNTAVQTQVGNWNLAYASQGGYMNNSVQTQVGASYATASARNESNHYQYGNRNTAISTQMGFKNLENVLQIGNGNLSTGTQSTFSIFSAGNNSLVCQQGTGLISVVNQSN